MSSNKRPTIEVVIAGGHKRSISSHKKGRQQTESGSYRGKEGGRGFVKKREGIRRRTSSTGRRGIKYHRRTLGTALGDNNYRKEKGK